MLITTSESIPGKNIVSTIGYVKGSSARARHAVADMFAGLKNIVGGELSAYTELLGESRDEAVQRMLQEAVGRGANAVVNVRMATSAITPGASEILAYGTAVIVE